MTQKDKLILVKQLRQETGCGLIDGKRCLNSVEWNYEEAKRLIEANWLFYSPFKPMRDKR